MKELALEILKKINDYGYDAYIVGGFVRDTILKIETKDIDITTNATPMELKNIFPEIKIDNSSYGEVTLYYNNERFEITTFREESEYLDNRHPSSITYVNSLEKDLLRRDFRINSLCMDKDGNIIDLLNGQIDLNRKVIDTITDSNVCFKRDSLRILRAIRFATILNFSLSERVFKAIVDNKELIKNLSYQRKKDELNKIFASKRAEKGIELIKKLGLVEVLELYNIDRIKDYSDVMGVWAMLKPFNYPFTNSEKDMIEKINEAYDKDNLDKYVLYKYGPYVNTIAGINKGLNKALIMKKYLELPINNQDDIMISVNEICEILKKKPGNFLKDIFYDLEHVILDGVIKNDSDVLKEYICSKYM